MAKKIRNISPYGDLDVPLLGRIVAAGEAVDVTDEAAAVLLDQTENWEPAGGPTTATGPVDATEEVK
jgi:hypothetical protein